MFTTRRTVTKMMAASALAPAAMARGAAGAATWDVAVIGAGAFGAWTAHALRQMGQRVCLIDAFGPANGRSSSGDETRIIRCSYGKQDIYSVWAHRSLAAWKALQVRSSEQLFESTGVLAIAQANDAYLDASAKALGHLGIAHERLTANAVMKRFPAFHLDRSEDALFEPASGALFAKRGIQTLVKELIAGGVDWRTAAIMTPAGGGALREIMTESGETISAGRYVFACGPWLPKVFPDVIGPRIEAQRAEVFFLGAPAGSAAFAPPAMPTWMDNYTSQNGAYGFPDLEARGCKIAVDPARATVIDPDTQSRMVTQPFIDVMREFAAFRFPSLAKAPIIETRVCQYEMTRDEDYILDRHPGFDNVWIAGGGSGHGFKNGPEVGKYMANLIHGMGEPDARFLIPSG